MGLKLDEKQSNRKFFLDQNTDLANLVRGGKRPYKYN